MIEPDSSNLFRRVDSSSCREHILIEADCTPTRDASKMLNPG